MSDWKYTSDIPDDFEVALLELCTRLRCKPLDLIGCWYSESGVHASAHNPGGDASGIFQAMPATLKNLGFPGTHEDYRKLSATEQLAWAEKYYANYAGSLDSAASCYVATFLPAFVKFSGNKDYVLCDNKDRLAWAYKANTVFDANHDGQITVSEMQQRIDSVTHGPRWDELVGRIAVANVKPDGVYDDRMLVCRDLTSSDG